MEAPPRLGAPRPFSSHHETKEGGRFRVHVIARTNYLQCKPPVFSSDRRLEQVKHAEASVKEQGGQGTRKRQQ